MSEEYGPGAGHTNLFKTIRFAEAFPDRRIVHALSEQLSWTHLRKIIYLEDPTRREFYTQIYRIERRRTGTLQDKIEGMLYEKTAISTKPRPRARKDLAVLREEDRMSPDLAFRDPYLLDSLGLKAAYTEKDFKTAIVRDLELFLLELDSDFSFVARQKRIKIDNQNYDLDLLFFQWASHVERSSGSGRHECRPRHSHLSEGLPQPVQVAQTCAYEVCGISNLAKSKEEYAKVRKRSAKVQKQARITSKGQITVPRDIRNTLGVGPGDRLLFESDSRGVRIRPVRAESPFEKYRGIGNPGLSPGRKAVRRWVRQLRGQ